MTNFVAFLQQMYDETKKLGEFSTFQMNSDGESGSDCGRVTSGAKNAQFA